MLSTHQIEQNELFSLYDPNITCLQDGETSNKSGQLVISKLDGGWHFFHPYQGKNIISSELFSWIPDSMEKIKFDLNNPLVRELFKKYKEDENKKDDENKTIPLPKWITSVEYDLYDTDTDDCDDDYFPLPETVNNVVFNKISNGSLLINMIKKIPAHITSFHCENLFDFPNKKLENIFSAVPQHIKKIDCSGWNDQKPPVKDSRLAILAPHIPETVKEVVVPINDTMMIGSEDYWKMGRNINMEEFRDEYHPYSRGEIVATIVSLGMYAYVKNCIGLNQNLGTCSAIGKILLAVIAPPVAMLIGIGSLFFRPTIPNSQINTPEDSKKHKI